MTIKEQIEKIRSNIESRKPKILENVKQTIVDKVQNLNKDIKIVQQDNGLIIEGMREEDLSRIMKSLTQTTFK